MSIKQRCSNGCAVRAADTVVQDWQAWELRCKHLTYREIGGELGIDPSTAYDVVQRAAQMVPDRGRLAEDHARHRRPARSDRVDARMICPDMPEHDLCALATNRSSLLRRPTRLPARREAGAAVAATSK
jgi:hypothetical protein